MHSCLSLAVPDSAIVDKVALEDGFQLTPGRTQHAESAVTASSQRRCVATIATSPTFG
jgi:hypothetical protein